VHRDTSRARPMVYCTDRNAKHFVRTRRQDTRPWARPIDTRQKCFTARIDDRFAAIGPMSGSGRSATVKSVRELPDRRRSQYDHIGHTAAEIARPSGAIRSITATALPRKHSFDASQQPFALNPWAERA